MVRLSLLAACSFAVLMVMLVACGDDDAKPAGEASTDEQYLKVVCTGLSNFSDALVSKTSSDEIAKVIKEYITSLKAVTPPRDLEKFHRDFEKYLQDALNDPTSLVTKTPPLPADEVRRRIASKEANVPECRNATFFSASKARP